MICFSHFPFTSSLSEAREEIFFIHSKNLWIRAQHSLTVRIKKEKKSQLSDPLRQSSAGPNRCPTGRRAPWTKEHLVFRCSFVNASHMREGNGYFRLPFTILWISILQDSLQATRQMEFYSPWYRHTLRHSSWQIWKDSCHQSYTHA